MVVSYLFLPITQNDYLLFFRNYIDKLTIIELILLTIRITIINQV